MVISSLLAITELVIRVTNWFRFTNVSPAIQVHPWSLSFFFYAKSPIQYSLWNCESIVTLSVPKTSVRTNFFIVKYSPLWNKVLHQLRILSPSSIAFKNEVHRTVTVPLLVYLYHPHPPEHRVYGTELDFWKTHWCHAFRWVRKRKWISPYEKPNLRRHLDFFCFSLLIDISLLISDTFGISIFSTTIVTGAAS